MPKHSLSDYKNKRNFKSTSEPSGKKRARKSGHPIFVIQKHDARNLHYDLRLEMDGVLKSWAVPKGPSTDPSEKRLAIETEDHPMDYASFEGVIPKGEYGAGEVIVWDKGTYRNKKGRKTVEKSYDDGEITVELKGKKLKGGYALVKTGERSGKNQWLFIKMDDEHADARRNPTSTEPKSVLSGKTVRDLKKEKR